MKTLFADTGYWIALLYPGDELHQRAITLTTEVGPCHIVTTQMILVEFLSFAADMDFYGKTLALNLIRNLTDNLNATVISQSDDQFQAALDLYSSRLDHHWSLTDCASFQVMEQLGIHEALAHARHFRQAGFRPLLRQD